MDVEKARMMSLDLTQENIKKIRELFPNVVTETKDDDGKVKLAVDFDSLKQELSDSLITEKQERYQMTWPDKKNSILLANKSVVATLRPVPEKSSDFNETKNVYIEGDNLDTLKLLRETYLGKIKMIYIDPPYNTGNDFVYNDDFSQSSDDYLDNSGQYDEYGNQLVQNGESNGRFHTDWLNMMYPRLKIAKDLLSDDGFLLVSIDDNEVDNLSKIITEIFGAKNVIGKFIVNSTPNARDYGHIGKMHEYVVFCAKNIETATSHMLPDEDRNFKYNDEKGGFNIHPLYNSNVAFTPKNRPNLYYPFYVDPNSKYGDFYKIYLEKQEGFVEVYPPKSVKDGVQFVWRWGKELSNNNLNKEIVAYKVGDEYRIVQKMRHSEKIIRSILTGTGFTTRKGTAEVESILGGKIFSFPKPLELIYDFVLATTNQDSYVLDFFAGSSTTAHAVIKANNYDGGQRKFILVQLPEKCGEETDAKKAGYETLCDIGEERIRRAGKVIKDENGLLENNLDVGFRVFRLDSSNMNEVYYNPKAMTQNILEATIDNIKPDRTPLDLLFQVMLECGALLSSKIEEKEINGKKVYIVEDNYIAACFDDEVDDKTVEAIAKLKPIYACFKGSSFSSDSANINAEQIFKTYSPNTEKIKVI